MGQDNFQGSNQDVQRSQQAIRGGQVDVRAGRQQVQPIQQYPQQPYRPHKDDHLKTLVFIMLVAILLIIGGLVVYNMIDGEEEEYKVDAADADNAAEVDNVDNVEVTNELKYFDEPYEIEDVKLWLTNIRLCNADDDVVTCEDKSEAELNKVVNLLYDVNLAPVDNVLKFNVGYAVFDAVNNIVFKVDEDFIYETSVEDGSIYYTIPARNTFSIDEGESEFGLHKIIVKVFSKLDNKEAIFAKQFELK